MSEQQRKVLNMLAEGKIDSDEAQRLLEALQARELPVVTTATEKRAPKYLRILVSSKGQDQVNIHVPLGLVRAGVKLGSIMPQGVKDQINQGLHNQGIPFNLEDINANNIDELLSHLHDLQIQINEGGDKINIYCE